ncbi:alpha/beta hydrolase [Sphingomonas immobilis]|uniref:Alpha/beta hydrolase n=1 Tax=Sphingomonas immobilis TaxID=3063997 RepID=A0ABT9A0D7_9SPHN|nr:alpha/beta hydrolase [Sphingomonas sp. CA1-15]MDO7842152.1 alpha/beta hydrolase [Sphingomonas sp. CA1-15]
MTDDRRAWTGRLDRDGAVAILGAMSPPDPAALRLRKPLPPRRAGRPADADLLARRGSSGGAPDVMLGGVACAVAGARDAARTIVHLHGGGYRMGSAAAWRPFAERLAVVTHARVIVPDYALAPEAPFPGALHDAAAVVGAAVADHGPVVLSGDSAGGGLALALAAALAPPVPLLGLVLLSPWIDLTLSGDSFDRCAASDALFSRASASAAAEAYLQGWDAADPRASPLFADLTALPPTLLAVSSSEVLCDESLDLLRRLALASVRTTAVIEPDVPHIWPVLATDAPAQRALDLIDGFVGALSAPCSAGSSGASD